MSIAKRVTYLKGLAEGLGLGHDTKEEKILHIIMEILEDIAVELEAVAEDVTVLDDDMSVLVEDMQNLEDMFFEEEVDEHCGCPAPSAGSGGANKPEKRERTQPEPQFYTVQCPACDDEITIDDGVLAQGAIDCPNCGERLELEE